MAALDSLALAGKDQRKQEDFRESCSLCLEAYVGRTPKLLPCFHTFCLPCLTALAESVMNGVSGIDTTAQSQSQSAEAEVEEKVDSVEDVDKECETRSGNEEKESAGGTDDEQVGHQGSERESVEDKEDKEEGGQVICGGGDSASKAVFLCPTCRAPVTVPEGGVSALQTNFYIVTEADEAPQPVPCEMCEEEDRKEAEFTCDKCRQSMCRTCRRLHDKFLGTKDHHARPLSTQEKASSRSTTEVNKCRVHQDQELCLFCKDCDVSICLVCKLTSHQPHVTEDMTVAAQRGREELKVLVNTAKDQVQLVKKVLIRLYRDVKELSRQEEEAIHHVKGHYDEIGMWACRVRDELLETISSNSKHALAGLKAEETSAHNIIDALSRLLSRAAPAINDNTQVLLLKNELQAALLGREQLEGHKRESEREQHRKFFIMKGDSSAVDLEIVGAYFGNLLIGNSGDVPPVSLREQIQALGGKLAGMKTSLDAELEGIKTGLDGKVTGMKTSLDGELEELKTGLDGKFTGMKTSLDAELEGMKTGLDGKFKKLDTKVLEIEKGLGAKLDEMKTKLASSVAFQACATSKIVVPKDGLVLLRQVKTNVGNAYSAATGVFSAPVSGVYSFQATLMAKLCCGDPQYMASVGLCAEQTTLATALCHEQSDQATISAVVHVPKTGRVFLKNLSVSSSVEIQTRTNGPTVSFSGFLLKAD